MWSAGLKSPAVAVRDRAAGTAPGATGSRARPSRPRAPGVAIARENISGLDQRPTLTKRKGAGDVARCMRRPRKPCWASSGARTASHAARKRSSSAGSTSKGLTNMTPPARRRRPRPGSPHRRSPAPPSRSRRRHPHAGRAARSRSPVRRQARGRGSRCRRDASAPSTLRAAPRRARRSSCRVDKPPTGQQTHSTNARKGVLCAAGESGSLSRGYQRRCRAAVAAQSIRGIYTRCIASHVRVRR